MNSTIFIPQKIRVGFQERSDTYTKKLAYVIYYDEKGKLRKEASWQSWRDKKIEPDEHENTPMEGFVLNKKVGGYASDWGNFRQAYVRVYDPRGFEFEITVPNLIYILEHTSSIKGKGLEGEFVYGWDGPDLLLIPTCAPDYKALAELNDKRFEKKSVKVKDLKIGATYLTRGNMHYIYLGKFDFYCQGYDVGDLWFSSFEKAHNYAWETGRTRHEEVTYPYRYTKVTPGYVYGSYGTDCKKHFFYVVETGEITAIKTSVGSIIDTVDEEMHPQFAEMMDKLETYDFFSPYDSSLDRVVCFDSVGQFILEHNQSHYGFYHLVMSNNGPVCIYLSVSNRSTDGLYGHTYTCSLYNDAYSLEKLRTVFPEDKIGPSTHRKETIPMTLEEIHEIAPLCYVEKHLANGRLWRKEYYKI